MNEPIEVFRKEATARIQMAISKGGWEGTHTDFKLEMGGKQRDHAKLIKHLIAFANTPRRSDAFLIYGFEEDKIHNNFAHVGVEDSGFPAKENIEQIVQSYTRLEGIVVDNQFRHDDKLSPEMQVRESRSFRIAPR